MTTDRIGALANNYWPVAAGVVAIAVAWGMSSAQIASIADGQKTISAKIDRLSEGQAATQTSVQYAGQEIAELRARVNALEVRR
jgi:outer membrane murein-binding lipoprotein Lpp